MSGYTKLFGSILDSTVWQEPPATKVVWVTMLAMADRDGLIEASVPGLAKRAVVTRAQCERALSVFLAPDADSRTPDFEGRRIEVIPGGWRLLNYETYRERGSIEEVRAKTAARVSRHRARKALQGVTAVTSNAGNAIAEASPSPSPPSSAAADDRPATAATRRNQTARGAGGAPPLNLGLRRLKVWRWMLDELIATLGEHAEAFDIEAWLHELDATEARVIPDVWPWLKTEMLAEAGRRGLPVAVAGPLLGKQTTQLAGALAVIKAEAS